MKRQGKADGDFVFGFLREGDIKKAVLDTGLYRIVFMMAVLANLSAVTNATTSVYTNRSLWEAAVPSYEEEFFTDAILNSGICVDAGDPPHGSVDVTGEKGYGAGVWWDRVAPSYDSTTWFFTDTIIGFGGYWNLAGPGDMGTGIQLYLDGIPVSEEIPNLLTNSFWGVVSTVPFNEILIVAGTYEGVAETYVMDNMVYATLLSSFTKTDDVEEGDCRRPGQEITYTICWNNALGQPLEDAYIIDLLPEDVDYPGGGYTVEPGDPNDPNQPLFSLVPPDAGYDPQTHSYCWNLGDAASNTSDCVELTVVVKNSAAPGIDLHNVAEFYAAVYDPNGQNPEIRMIARKELDTQVCCWGDTPEILYVDQNAISGGNVGVNWANAYLDLQDALAYARTEACGQVQAIYVAQGVYSPGENERDSFVLPDNVSLYGGFPTGGCEFNLRNPKRYETALSGKIDQYLRNDTVIDVGDSCLTDGFTISEAGEYCIHGSGVDFSLVQCTIENSWQYGVRASDSNVDINWCTVRNNLFDGVWHAGSGSTLNINNSWIRKNMWRGIRCDYSTPIVKNSIVTESDISETGNAGIRMVNPSSHPVLQNCTISHNKSVGISVTGNRMPSVINSIVYHNNSGGRQLSANMNPDVVAQYCCIADCNEVNNNINVDPEFAYFDPDNVRIIEDSPCHDSGLTLQENYAQVDMDNRTRVLGYAVDRGAYEIECEDTSNSFDFNADGMVNLYEFNGLSKAWLSHDPNDPVWLGDPNLADPNLSEGWYEWKYQYNYETTGASQYVIDLADLAAFVEDAPWLWQACWLDLEELQMQQMADGGEEMLMMSGDFMALDSMQSLSVPAEPPLSVEDQIARLEDSLIFLARIWLEEPDIQQQINPKDWQEFMGAVYQSLLNLQTQAVQIE